MVKILSPWLTLVASFLETPHIVKNMRGCLFGSVEVCGSCKILADPRFIQFALDRC